MEKKKSMKTVRIILGIILTLWLFTKFTNVIKVYNIPITSNAPTLKPGDRIFSSNLLKPKRFDFICFTVERPEGNTETRTYRLCGLEGDSIEIKNGLLYVNGDNADQHLTLTNEYNLPASYLPQIEEEGHLDESDARMISQDSFRIFISEKYLHEKGMKGRRIVLKKYDVDESIKAKYGRNWNQDHFGPLVVPKGKFFLLGDNRHGCEDSRYLGFIDQTAFIGTVIGRQ